MLTALPPEKDTESLRPAAVLHDFPETKDFVRLFFNLALLLLDRAADFYPTSFRLRVNLWRFRLIMSMNIAGPARAGNQFRPKS